MHDEEYGQRVLSVIDNSPPAPSGVDINRAIQAGRRQQAVQRGRYAVAGAATAMTLAVGVAMLPGWLRSDSVTPSVTQSAAPSPEPSLSQRPITTLAQRWVVYGGSRGDFVYTPGGEPKEYKKFEDVPPGTKGVWFGAGELLADGSLKPVPTTSVGRSGGAHNAMFLTENGSYVFEVYRSRAPKGAPDDRGPCDNKSENWLIVVNAAGKEVVKRNLYTACHPWELAGADSAYAYLVRDGKLRKHRLSDGAETVLFDVAEPKKVAGTEDRLSGWMDRVSIFGRYALVIRQWWDTHDTKPFPERIVRTVHLDTNAVSERSFQIGELEGGVLSPDGQWLAVIDQGPARSMALNLRSGEVRPLVLNTATLPTVCGIGWADDNTLRVAWFESQQERLMRFEEVLRTTDFRL